MAEINASITDIIYKFLDTLKEQGIHVHSAYLFGSYAKGSENKWSDIDIAVISPDIKYDRYRERIRLMKLSARIDTRIEPAPFRPDTFVDEDPLAWEIKRVGIPIKQISN